MLGKRSQLVALLCIPTLLTISGLVSANSHDDYSVEAPRTFEPFMGVVNSKVRLRNKPTTDSHVIKEALAGDTLAILGEEQGFYSVAVPKDLKVYVFGKFVSNGYIQGNRINIRLYPDTSAPIMCQVSAPLKVLTKVCESNPEWCEIANPEFCRLFIAKQFVEKKGSIETLVNLERKKTVAIQAVNTAISFANEEIKKPFEEINIDSIRRRLDHIFITYEEFADLIDLSKNAFENVQKIYNNKRDVYLSKSDSTLDSETEKKEESNEASLFEDIIFTSDNKEEETKTVVELEETPKIVEPIKLHFDEALKAFQHVEDSYFSSWASNQSFPSQKAFMESLFANSTSVVGKIEPYTITLKSRPGDFILKNENNEVIGFVYSSYINLDNFIGKQTSFVLSERPNNNFAYPAYCVIDANING